MPPALDQNQLDADLGLPPLIECSNNSSVPTCSLIFIFFLLVFYALALWDRWLNLKLRESQKLQYIAPRSYGAIQGSPSRPPSVSRVIFTPPPRPADQRTGNPKLSQKQKGSTDSIEDYPFIKPGIDDQSSSHLAPPTFDS
ncbi:hypothetical protein C8F04DRAFT_345931 [Mycena alexandri]|uniref:Uncharacterized protein n=1 Tax=Mycena alexandri TaxID=1745969 RepID=A0AAD6TK63_9AGAR|nr:hypothetical protein C8F04DRAFT_345931 [Mycena alexandri]